jgi:hypothetical protein
MLDERRGSHARTHALIAQMGDQDAAVLDPAIS